MYVADPVRESPVSMYLPASNPFLVKTLDDLPTGLMLSLEFPSCGDAYAMRKSRFPAVANRCDEEEANEQEDEVAGSEQLVVDGVFFIPSSGCTLTSSSPLSPPAWSRLCVHVTGYDPISPAGVEK